MFDSAAATCRGAPSAITWAPTAWLNEPMTQERFAVNGIDAVVFDVIGTLVDEDASWAAAARRIAAETGVDSADDLHALWARLLDEKMSAVIDGDAPWQRHSRLVVEAADEAIRALGGSPTASTTRLLSNLDAEYPAFPDVAAATAALRRTRLVAGVSNGDLDALARLANLNGISWDIALSTGAAQTFKPAPSAYEYAIDTLRIDPGRTLFVAAHPWDLRAAAGHGFRTAYIGRPGAERPSEVDRFDVTVKDLTALSHLLA